MTQYIAPATKILRYPETLAAMQRGERVWPLHVEVDLCGSCNLDCAWCRFAGRRDDSLMDDAVCTDLLTQLADGGTKAVTFSGGGEPSLSPYLADVARYASDRLGLKVGVYTNGTGRAQLLQAAPWCTWVYVSLDAADANSYVMDKGTDEFDAVCDTIKQLHGLAPVLGVGFLLHGYNYPCIDDMERLGRALGATYVQFRPVAGLEDYDWVPGALRRLARCDADYSRERFMRLFEHWLGRYQRGYTVCRGSELAPCIGADGTVWVCPNTRGLRSLGNIHERPFAELWRERPTQMVGADCEPTCRHHALNRTLALVCEQQAHEEFI